MGRTSQRGTSIIEGPGQVVRGRRIARLVPPGTSQAVVLKAVRNALLVGWAPTAAARTLLEYVDGDTALLRQARLRLRSTAIGRPTLVRARAIASLNIAIATLDEEAGPGSGEQP